MSAIPPGRLGVRYADRPTAHALAARQNLLGVIGYGCPAPDFLPPSCPFVTAPLRPAAGGEIFEIWTAESPTRPFQAGPVTGARSEDFAFGAVALDACQLPLEDAVEHAYLHIFNFLDQAGFPAPLRVWNYLTAILQNEDGLERYRRFNIGRHRAFSARLRDPVPPAASCIGATSGPAVIYFLAGRQPATAIENPRQISAYAYPPVYGPRSPSFSRAGLLPGGGGGALFISGTASIIGHETRHAGNAPAQLVETAENLLALINAARQHANGAADGPWAVKIYLRDPTHQPAAEAAANAVFGQDSQHLVLIGEICRPGLLLEIEAFRHAAQTIAL